MQDIEKHNPDCAHWHGEKCDCQRKVEDDAGEAGDSDESESDKRRAEDKLAAEIAKKWKVGPRMRRVRKDE